jgi:hypothetical protein
VWASNTDGNPGARLILQDDGNLVIYRADGTPLWASNTPEGVFRFDLTQVNGWIQLELHRDGTVHFSGHAHNDALISESVQYTVRVALGLDTIAVLQHSGNLAGLGGTPQERNDYWDERFVRSDVRLNYDALVSGTFQVFEYRKGAVLGVVGQMLDFLRSAVIGVLIPPELGLVLFLGGEIAGLAATGSLVPASEILSGTLYMLGPSGSLYALAGEGLAEIGQRRRPISDQEYAWANSKVFSGSLAPKAQIIVTDTIGANGRPFTFPGPGDITVNLGPKDFADPMTTDPGTFIHELTHVWQLHNSPGESDWVARGFAAQIGNVPYSYGPAGPPYSDFNIEQQAQIVQDWFTKSEAAGHELDTDPYFIYIRDNIRTGNLL